MDAKHRVQEVAGLLHEQKWAEALALSDQAIAEFPGSHDLWVNKGIALRRLKRLDDALAAYDRANALDANDADCWLNRGVCIRAMNRPHMHEKAVASYTRAVEVDPNCADALMNLGNVSSRIACFYATDAEVKKQHYRRMEDAYRRALTVKPDSWELYGNMAMGFIKQGLFAQAIEQADRSIALNAEYADAWYLRGYALMELKRFPEALESFHKAAAVMPSGDDFGLRVWVNAGTVLFLMGRMEDALEAYGTAAAIEPRDRMYYRGCRANALYNMAVVYNRLRRDEEARQSLEESLKLRMEEETFTEPVKEFVGPAACDTEHIKEGR